MTDTEAERIARVAKILSHPRRVRILSMLSVGPSCVSDLLEEIGCEQPNLSQHLALMRAEGIVRCRRDGQFRVYSVDGPNTIDNLLGELSLIDQGCERARETARGCSKSRS